VKTVLVAGATGHVGMALVDALRTRGHDVRALSRSGGDGVVEGDVSDRKAMLAALEGVEAAYYLVHSLEAAGDFGDAETHAAGVFATAARERGVERIVYLGGIVHGTDLSAHLESRRAVGEILRSSAVPAIEFRASIVVGAGSASFELVRDLVERLPLLVGPDWLDNPAQPIALEDVVAYLVEALELPLTDSVVYEIGGADRVTYRALVDEVARQTGGTPTAAVVPVPSPPVSASDLPSALTQLIPERARLAANLIESLRYDTAVSDDAALADFRVRPKGIEDAVREALA
jgi:uncharacterized protein YbjT (DUF2867 family)